MGSIRVITESLQETSLKVLGDGKVVMRGRKCKALNEALVARRESSGSSFYQALSNQSSNKLSCSLQRPFPKLV